MYLNPTGFDNGEGGREGFLYLPFYPNQEASARGETVRDLIIKTLLSLAEHGRTVVIVYPTPEVGWHVPKLVKEKLDQAAVGSVGRKRSAFEKLNITTNYDVYKQRSARSYEILDQAKHSNILRVYPSTLFCSDETGRCRTHDDKKLFYYDDDHLSQTGASMLIELIAETLER